MRFRGLWVYIGAVIVAGIGMMSLVVLGGAEPQIGGAYTEFWILAALVGVGELLSIESARLDGDGEITTSTLFTFALLLRFGVVAAVMAQAVASFGADLHNGKPVWKAAFNASQFTIALLAAGFVLQALTSAAWLDGIPDFATIDIPGILIAAGVFFIINSALPRIGIALSQGESVGPFLMRDLGFHTSVNGALLALSPIVVVSASRSIFLIPLLTLPMAIIYKAATVYAEKEYKAYQALHDELTGLPNRALFYDRVEQAILQTVRTGNSLAVMIIDLDRFKEINDSLGHHIGDLLLKRIGPRLAALLRPTDTIARLGGDEFLVLLPNLGSEEDAKTVASKIVGALNDPFVLEEVSVELTLDVEASIGIAMGPAHGKDVDTLIQRADVAMYLAKETHSGFELYTGERDRNSASQVALLGELRRAMEQQELFLCYQPKTELETGRVVGFEALLRWQHPKRGLVFPDAFIPPAERTGLIRPLTLYALDLALAEVKKWRAQGNDLTVAVNLSRRNLLDLDFPGEVREALDRWGVVPDALELEITESDIMADPERAAGVLNRLHDIGIELSLDDFGAGYSSLAYLKKLPVGQIKIDKSFVLDMSEDADDEVIVKSTIDLGHNLGFTVVAEGVETLETSNRLTELGCHLAQGFLIAKPMTASDVSPWLKQYTEPPLVERLHGSMPNAWVARR